MARPDLFSRLEPEMQPLLEQMPPWDHSDIGRLRAGSFAARDAALGLPHRDDVETRDHSVPGFEGEPPIRVREYRPRGAGVDVALPALVWFHGGGYVMGFIETDDSPLEALVATLGIAVFSVEWRWAPEHPYPASLHDAIASACWVHERAAELGVDALRIAIGGKSSGAGTAAALALYLRDHGLFRPVLQLLVYPMLDDRDATPSSREITDPRLWARDVNRFAWRCFLGELHGGDVPAYAAPSRATDLSGLPRAFLCVGELDLFLDEDIEYAQRLLQAGVPTELHVYPGAIHGFDSRLPTSPVAVQFTEDRDRALRAAIDPRRPHSPRGERDDAH